MVVLVLLVGVIAFLCYAFYSWARKQGLTGDNAPPPEGEPTGHVSLLTEAVSYLGVILILAGGVASIARRWSDISDWGHVGVFAAAATLFLTVGAVLFTTADPALQRLVAVVWVLSIACIAGTVAFAVHDVFGRSAQLTALLVGVSTTACSTVLWLLRRHVLQNVAVFLSLIVTICGTVATIAHGTAPALAFSLSLWTLGLLWVLAGWRRWVEPMWATVPLGILLALIAPALAVSVHGWLYLLAIVTAAAVMASSVPLRNTPQLAMGTLGLFGYLTSLVIRYFADTLGAPTALALTGGLILVLAAVGTRLMKAMKKPEPARLEPARLEPARLEPARLEPAPPKPQVATGAPATGEPGQDLPTAP